MSAIAGLLTDVEAKLRAFGKYTMFALGVQIALLFVLGFVGTQISPAIDLVFGVFLLIYEPMILLIASIGSFRGESAMIEPVWMGIALGVGIYSTIFGIAATLAKRQHFLM